MFIHFLCVRETSLPVGVREGDGIWPAFMDVLADFFRVTLVRFFFYKNVYCLNFDLRLNQDSTFLFWQHSSMAFHHVLFTHEVLTFNFNLNQVKNYNIPGILYFIFVVWVNSRAGKLKRFPLSDWLPEQARWAHLARSGLPALVPQEKVLFLAIL